MKGTIKGAMTRLMSTDGGGQLGVTRQAPLGFRMKDALGKFLRICKEPQYRPVLYCTAAASVLTSWYLAYSFFTERNYRSSFLVRQTLYNLRCNAGVCKVLGVTPQIVPRTTTGYMYQRRGDADISFDVVGKDGARASVHVVAKRREWDWITRSLVVTLENGDCLILAGEGTL